ncbi:MAG: hypothetical protein J3Q66DRAFT_324355 [Benniella sp.]|nr:MAG: hypothetical protein J3Q66DRAFT_324355 [Benniella sp.]
MVKTADNKTVVLLQHPTGYPQAGVHIGVQYREIDTTLNEGDVLVRNLYISLDPYLRGRMNGIKDYIVPSYQINGPFDGHGVSEVIESKNSKLPVGTLVTYDMTRWEERSVVPASIAKDLVVLPEGARNSKIPISSYIGVLGMPGFTAHASLLEIGQPKAGETIFISAASGAVGQLVGQIAKLKGLRVVGSAGSDQKVEFLLKELKFDAAFNYKKGNILESLRAAAPEGIDIYYENVGGETLEAVLDVMKLHGRIIVCGLISGYNTNESYHVKNLVQILAKRLTIKGFVVADFNEEIENAFQKDVTAWLLEDKIVYKEDITEGLENAPEAFTGVFEGKNFGKAVVKIAGL